MRNSRSVAGGLALPLVVLYLGAYLCEAKAGPPPAKDITVDLAGGVKMEFVLIPAGEFMMGGGESPEAVGKAFDLPSTVVPTLRDEHPQHRVRISKAFYLGKYEVTQEQWKAVMGSNPTSSHFKGPKKPVVDVSWNACRTFMNKLNQKFSRTGVKFSLPTEAQWEYACRAGTSTRFSFGDDGASLEDYAWTYRNSGSPGGRTTHPVGQKKPNAWGLYDMLGNVQEWCSDWYREDYYKQSPRDDPTGRVSGKHRVLRGGSWYYDRPFFFRCAYRLRSSPDAGSPHCGLRVVRTLAP